MGREHGTDWQQELASALEWWRDAGVDTLVEDEPRDWLARVAPASAPAAAAVVEAEVLPDTLEAFVAWRMSDAAPEAEWFAPRIAPSGPADAALMVLADMPDPEDGEAGHLLSGAAGRLFDRILAAIGESRESVYVASLAIAHPITTRIPADQEARLVEIARHHIALVAPKRLLLLGQSASRVFAATSDGETGKNGSDVNQFAGEMEVVAIDHPRFLLTRPARKAEAWKKLMPLVGGIRP